MRVFALSDIHIDYSGNQAWIADLSRIDYQDDVLILAGDITDFLPKLEWCFQTLAACFRQVLFVPGNHDLWVMRDKVVPDSLQKFDLIRQIATDTGVAMQTWSHGSLTVVPLLGWYDYSFGVPGALLQEAWMDFRACNWPDGYDAAAITRHFVQLNLPNLVGLPYQPSSPNRANVFNQHDAGLFAPSAIAVPAAPPAHMVISFSHFLPRIDVMPHYIPPDKRMVYPVLGSSLIEAQVRAIAPQIHVYGHSHVNRRILIDGVEYINNAFGYPNETRITAKQLLCITTL